MSWRPFGNRSLRGVWLASTAVIARALQQATAFLLVLFAARFLEPAEFGIYTLAVAIVLLLQTLAYTGLYDFIVAEKGDERAIRSTTFWLMIGLSLAGAAVMFAGAEIIAGLFDAPDLAGPLRWLAANQPLSAAVAWISAVLLREDRLSVHYNVMIVQNLAALAVGLVLLATWQSVYSLVAHRYARSIVGLVLYFGWCRYAPGLAFARGLAARALRYSSGLYGARLLGYLSQNGAIFILGIALAPTQLGIFRFGERLAAASLSVLTEPMRSFAITRMSWLNRRGEPTTPLYYRFLTTMILVLGCAGAAVAVLSGPLIAVAFQPSYAPAQPVAVAIAVSVVVSLGYLLLDPLLAARGRTGLLFWLQLGTVTASVGAVLAAVPFGLEAVAWSRAALALATSLLAMAMVARMAEPGARLPLGRILAALALVGAYAALVAAAHRLAGQLLPDAMVALIAAGAAAALAGLAVLAIGRVAGLFFLDLFTDRRQSKGPPPETGNAGSDPA